MCVTYYLYIKRKMVDKSMKKSQKNAKSRRRFVKKCPVEVGNEYEVDITEITPQGAGIARIKGFLILVGDSRPGDHIKVMITRTDVLNAEAEIVT
jgi:predicted RNA-binding protein with TRAM domain